MTGRRRRARDHAARPIRTRRDYDGAAAVVKRLSSQPDRDSAAEKRLASLLREMDKFDDPEDAAAEDFAEDDDYAGPRRRWSDDT